MLVRGRIKHDQPIDQVGPFLTSRLHELRAEAVYCQWQCTLLQTLTMTQPPGSHRPLHGLHLTANKVPHTRSCVGIGHSQRECSPLHHVEVPTHAGLQNELQNIPQCTIQNLVTSYIIIILYYINCYIILVVILYYIL